MARCSDGKKSFLVRAMIASNMDRKPSQIEEGLFLGARGASTNYYELKRLNVTHVLTVTGSVPPRYPNVFKYKVIQVSDRTDTDLSHYFDECFEFIDEAKEMGGGVLVHCYMGRSRSVAIVAAYMMKKHGLSHYQALSHVTSKLPKSAPNSGFVEQLQMFEKSLLEAKNALTANTRDEAVEQHT